MSEQDPLLRMVASSIETVRKMDMALKNFTALLNDSSTAEKLRSFGESVPASHVFGIPIKSSPLVPQGQVLLVGKDPQSIIMGSRPFTESERIVRDMCADVFGKEWLKSIGAWTYSTSELLEIMRSAKP